MFNFPGVPKMDGPDGMVATIQRIAASFRHMEQLLESIDRRLSAIEQGGKWPTLGGPTE